jgi:hypothetical protein
MLASPASPHPIRSAPTAPPTPPQVVLRGARDLPVWGLPWQSNPAARLTLGGQAVVSRRDAETSQPSRHRAPQWNQEFQFLVEDPDAQVRRLRVVAAERPFRIRCCS